MRTVFVAALAGALGITLSSPSVAHACGGCFIPPVQGADHGTVVTAHRMALAISPDQTTLWDQIQYSGSPSEFAWVLPVKPGARIEVATDAWFDVLEAATQALVEPPLLTCQGAPSFLGCSVASPLDTPLASSFGCGASAADGTGPTSVPAPVTVVNHGSVGPYEAEVLHSNDPNVLPAWLADHGYDIPGDVAPLIESYATEGFDFAVLRLLPAAGVSQMRPVRIVQPGAVPTLPLRMVAAGTGARTDITLFVIGEGRYTTKNFPEIEIPADALVWDFQASASNYARMRSAFMDVGGGDSFIAPYAEPGPLFGLITNAATKLPMTYETTNKWMHSTIAEAFVSQAFVNGETASTDCTDRFDGLETDSRRVVLPCDATGNCKDVDLATEIDGRSLMCAPPLGSEIPLDDLAQAVAGMHPKDVWITRLEASLSRKALAHDLELMPAPDQIEKNGAIAAKLGENLPATCELKKDDAKPVASIWPSDDRPHGRGGGFDGRIVIGLFMAACSALLALRRHGRPTLVARASRVRA